MDYKKTNAETTTITRNTQSLGDYTGNTYEVISIMSKRANQISIEIKDELKAKLEEFATHSDNLEEIFENREQIEISKFYERLPKATLISIQELIEDNIYYRNPEVEVEPVKEEE